MNGELAENSELDMSALSSLLDDASELALSEYGDENDDLDYESERDEYDLRSGSLPPHHCRYCGIHSPASVVKCLSCDKWFCNSRGMTSGGHIINHLVRSKHKAVCLHEDSPLGDAVLECYNCGTRNVFLLGFIPATQDSVVVLICREPCLNVNSIKDMNWDVTQWTPLITERCFLPWLVETPSDEELLPARAISSDQIRRLEELWLTDPTAFLEDLEKPGIEEDVEHTSIRYEDAQHYQRVYRKLVQIESEEDKKLKAAMTQNNVVIRWDMSLSGKLQAIFQLNRHSEGAWRIVPGELLRLSYPTAVGKSGWTCEGMVTHINLLEEVVLELDSKLGAPKDQTLGFTLEIVWKPTSFERMERALKKFLIDEMACTKNVYDTLLGHVLEPRPILKALPENLSAPGLPGLNHSQMDAVKSVLQKSFSLIQGPPGTGKTVTSATIVYHLVKRVSSSAKDKILVCAPSNIGVDQLTEKIHRTGVRVVRLCAKSRESVDSSVDYLSLHNLVVQYAANANDDLHRYITLKKTQGELNTRDRKRYLHLLRNTEDMILKSADVICCTCVGSGDLRLRRFRFKQVLVDECTQAAEPEALIPLVKGAKQVVLVGDHCQLGPVIMAQRAANAGLNVSLFERLIILGIRPIRLQVQYRMHPCLSEFPSVTFYEGSLQNGVTNFDRIQTAVSFTWPIPETPMFFYATGGREEFSASGTSFLNRVEASSVEKIVTQFLAAGAHPDQIGVITPYEGQRAHIVSHMTRNGTLRKSLYEQIEVASVDAFQGREKDYIIMSCVRSNERQGIGFLQDPRRMNVAITRARYGMIVLGNPKVLCNSPLWNNLLCHFQNLGLLIEGPLTALKPCVVRLNRPTKFNNESTSTHMADGQDIDDDYAEYCRNGNTTADESDEVVLQSPTFNIQPIAPPVYAHPGAIPASNFASLSSFGSFHLGLSK